MDFNFWLRGLIISLLFSVKLLGQDLDVLPAVSSLSLSNKILVDQGTRSKSATLTQLQTLIGTGISLDWSRITTGKPTTLAGYGIVDAALDAGVLHKAGTETITGKKIINNVDIEILNSTISPRIYNTNSKSGIQFGGALKIFSTGNDLLDLFELSMATDGSFDLNSNTIGSSGGGADMHFKVVSDGAKFEITGGGLSVSTIAGTGTRAVEADLNGNLIAIGRRNRTLAVDVSVISRSTFGETDYGSYTIPDNTLTTNGDVVTYSVKGDALVTGQKSFKIYFGAILISELHSSSAAILQATNTVSIMRTSSTTAEVFYTPLNPTTATQNVPSAGSLTGLNFAASIIVKSAIQHDGSGGGSSSITARAARITFEPAP